MTENPIASRALADVAAAPPPAIYSTAMPISEDAPGVVYGEVPRGGAEVNPTYSPVEPQQFRRPRPDSLC